MPLCPIFGAPYYNYGIIYLQNPILIIQTPIIEARIVTSMVPYDICSITYIESLLFQWLRPLYQSDIKSLTLINQAGPNRLQATKAKEPDRDLFSLNPTGSKGRDPQKDLSIRILQGHPYLIGFLDKGVYMGYPRNPSFVWNCLASSSCWRTALMPLLRALGACCHHTWS